MRKKIFYIGLLIFAIALVSFFASGTLFSSALTRVITTINLTISSGNYSFARIEQGNASFVALYAASTNKTNMYLFNTSTFHLWSSYMNANHSANGLAYARTLDASGVPFINNDTSSLQVVLTPNQSITGTNNSVTKMSQLNGTTYVVIDNTKGSLSYNTMLRGVVSYFKLTSSNLSAYNNVAITELAIILIGLAGIVIAVYGAIKKPPAEAATASKGGEPTTVSKEYIDSLYKNVGNSKKSKKKT